MKHLKILKTHGIIAVLLAASLPVLFSVPASAKDYWSTADLNIRDAPEGTVIGSYYPGQPVNVIDDSGTWFQTDLGYVSSEYLTDDPALAPARNYLAYDESQFPLTYSDEGLEITIFREEGYDSVWYAADVILDDPGRIRTLFPGGYWGGHATATEADKEAGGTILMVNGDFRDPTNAQHLGIIRGGEIINDRPMKKASIGLTQEGDIVSTKGKEPSDVIAMGVRETWSFGPFLVKKGKPTAHKNTETHPRTFIGQVSRDDSRKEYWIIVADGRWNGYSNGLTQDQMTEILMQKNCVIGFNLDGGGSSVMLFLGKVVNRPSDGEQRPDADYIYIR